ncbi:carboxypeptidase regulatory-like domain-containing protein [Bdellovibrionota bacterium FG-2]
MTKWIAVIGMSLFLNQVVWADSGIRLEGSLLERGTRKPLSGFSVYILPSKKKVQTGAQGEFVFEGVPPGVFRWVVSASGYRRLEQPDLQTEAQVALGENAPRVLYLEKESYQVYETTIVGKQKKRDDAQRTLKREEFLQAPGSGGDPIKAVQNLPGVNRPSSFSAQVVIQGSGPQDTRYLLEGHEVPLVFHFGGLSSVVIPEAVDRVETLSAGFGPEYGRATGGLVGVWTRPAQKDRMHGLAFMDVINAGALVEGPIGKESSYLLSVRKSYIGAVLGLIAKGNEDFNLTVAPAYSDITAVVDSTLTPIDEGKVSFFGSEDGLEFLLKEPVRQEPSLRGDFSSSTAFFRVIPQLTHHHSAITTSRWSLGLGRDWIKVVNGETYFRLGVFTLTPKGEIERKMNSFWTTFLGFDDRYTWATANLSAPSFYSAGGVSNPMSVGTSRIADVSAQTSSIGVFSRNEIKFENSDWTLMPNARVDYFSSTHETLVAPRPALRYALSESLFLRGAGGSYYQPPPDQNLDPSVGNPDLKASRAIHVSVGGEKDFREGSSRGFVLASDGFWKYLDRQIIGSSRLTTREKVLVPENFSNDGKGRVYGVQSQLKWRGDPWTGAIIYTLSKSTRWNPGQPEYPSSYDQTHLLGFLGSVEFGRNWKLSSRFRYATGNPKTPIEGGILDADNDVYVPVRGPYFSTRLSSFYQWDLRVDKKWAFDKWILSLYLDVQNVTNRKNPEAIIYAYDFSRSATIDGLPIIPTFGLKGEF